MKIFRKKSFLVTLVALGAFVMASCSSKKSTTQKTTTEPEPDYKKSERAMENF